MAEYSSRRWLLLCCDSVWAFMILFFVGWLLLAGFLPPLDPAANATRIAALFADHSIAIRLGMLACLYSAFFLLPFTAVMAHQIARMERGRPRICTYVMLMAGAGNILTFTFPILFWAVAAFRPDRSPDLVLLVNDLAWIPFVGMTVPFQGMPFAFAAATFLDRSPQPIFPRWSAYYNLATMLFIMPGGMITFFRSGPFAWNGLFGWWVPVTDFFIWFIVTWLLLRRAILREGDAAIAEGRAA